MYQTLNITFSVLVQPKGWRRKFCHYKKAFALQILSRLSQDLITFNEQKKIYLGAIFFFRNWNWIWNSRQLRTNATRTTRSLVAN